MLVGCPLSTAQQALDIENTKRHERINDGILETVTIGLRGKRIAVEFIERAATQGIDPRGGESSPMPITVAEPQLDLNIRRVSRR